MACSTWNWAGKAAVHRPFVPMAKEGRERWTLVRIWQESKAAHGVCASICVLIDEMNSGSGKLILAEADLPLYTFQLACRSTLYVLSFLPNPPFLFKIGFFSFAC